MALDVNEIQKPLDKLRKLLKKWPRQPSPKKVHDIRTRTRRTEAALSALSLDQKPSGKRLLKTLKPVRKRAGKVRDMDVLTGFASTLATDRDTECRVKLLEYLGKQRFDGTRKLRKTVVRKRNTAVQSLKRCSSSIKKRFHQNNARRDWPADAAAMALQLSRELVAWPRLTASNLHPFRLKAKELRNVLQLSGKDGDLVETLGQVKDAIGEWHDWAELGNIADEILDHSPGCAVRDQIRAETNRRFEKAMAEANAMRERYFQRPRAKKKNARSEPLKEPVLKASATLVA